MLGIWFIYFLDILRYITFRHLQQYIVLKEWHPTSLNNLSTKDTANTLEVIMYLEHDQNHFNINTAVTNQKKKKKEFLIA